MAGIPIFTYVTLDVPLGVLQLMSYLGKFVGDDVASALDGF